MTSMPWRSHQTASRRFQIWKQAVSASQDKTLKVWDLETGRALRTLEGHSNDVNAVAVTPDGKQAVSDLEAGGIRFSGQDAKGLGPGDGPCAADAGGPL